MTAWLLAPPEPPNCPVGSIAGFQPTMVPSSVSKRNKAEAVVVRPALFEPVTSNALLAEAVLNTVPVGVRRSG